MDPLVKSKGSNDDSVGVNRLRMTLRASTTGRIDTSSPGSDEIVPGSSVLPMARIETDAKSPFTTQKQDSKRQLGNNENNANGSPPKKARQQTGSLASRSPLSPSSVAIKRKNAKENNDLVGATRNALVDLSKSERWLTSYSSRSITIALGQHGNDPKLAANYILSLHLCQEVNTDAPSVPNISNTIASKTHSSIEMLSKLSAPRPPGNKVALGVVKNPKKNVHFYPDNENTKKLNARGKANLLWDNVFGASIEEFDGTCDLEKQLKRLGKAEGMVVSLVQKKPDDNGWNPSQRTGNFAQCAECNQVFACMHQDEQNPERRYLVFHKSQCGKTVCACGATKDQLQDKIKEDAEAKGHNKSATSISISAANHFRCCTIKDSDMLDFNQRFLKNFEWERNKLPPQLGIESLLEGKSEEECKRLKREFTPKKMLQLRNWMSQRLSGKGWMSTDACRRLKKLGYDTKKVNVWDC